MATTTPTATRAARATRPQRTETWTGWVGFSAITLLIVAGVTAFEGLIAVIRDQYFVVAGHQVIVFDLTTWGWIMLLWGVLLGFAAFSLAAGRGWARWFTLVLVGANVLGQLGFLGNTQYPLWTLVAIALDTLVIYGLTARWNEAR
jgi:hypothetical protein